MTTEEIELKVKTMSAALTDLIVAFSDLFVEITERDEIIKQLRSEVAKRDQWIEDVESRIDICQKAISGNYYALKGDTNDRR